MLAHAVAARLVVHADRRPGRPRRGVVVLTGGGIAGAMHRAVRDGPARDAVDWSRVDFWWGDERFLPAGHPDRNETQARAALLDRCRCRPARVHAMPASDGPDGNDPEAAAERYAAELAAAARPGTARLPHFDVLMLGVGEDGHVASVFPEHPVAYETRPVSAVRGSPKPPPVRTTLTLPTINTAEEVWLVAAGAGQGRARWAWPWPGRARCRCRRPACTASTAPSGCSTARRPPRWAAPSAASAAEPAEPADAAGSVAGSARDL